MAEFEDPAAKERVLCRVREEQNAIEDKLRENFLASNFYHNHLLGSFFNDDSPNGYGAKLDELPALHAEFMHEKRDKNMGERFAMALSDKYLDKIHVVELGLSTNPSNRGEVDDLKDEWNDLRHWMQSQGLIDDELSRQASGRELDLRRSKVAPDRIVVVRTRPLVTANVNDISILIWKRMVFSVPEKLCQMVANLTQDEYLNSEAALQLFEQYMEPTSPLNSQLSSIRTGYYLASRRNAT